MDTQKNKSQFQFTDPQLLESVFILNDHYKKDYSKIGKLQFQIKCSVGDKIRLNKEDTYYSSAVVVSIMTDENIKFNETIPCYLKITMCANFKWDDTELKSDLIDSFLEVNAPALLTSYIRPKITEVTEDTPITTQHLPFINFRKQSKQQ